MQKENFIIAARFTENGIKDITGNSWVNTGARTIAGDGRFGGSSFNIQAGLRGFVCSNVLPCNWSAKDEWTISFWVKRTNNGGYWEVVIGETKSGTANSVMAANDGAIGKPALRMGGSSSYIVSSKELGINKWQHVAFTCKDGRIYCFLDGSLQTTAPSKAWNMSCIALGSWQSHHEASGQYYVDDVCILNKCLWVSDFTPPDTYLYNAATKALLVAKKPMNLLDKSSITGFAINGIEPGNTSRHVAFKVDDVWNKLTINSREATLSPLPTQDITVDSLIVEGNTVAELESVTNCPPFVGKLVYPAVALFADENAEVMPTFGMTVKAEIDTTVNVYSYTDYSQEYAISDGDDVSIVSLVAETELKGNGKVDITAKIKSNGEWSEYMSLNAVQMKQASAIQLKAVYTVQNTDGSDSAKITGVVIKYNTAGAVTSNATTEIVTVTQKFTNDLTYVHAYCKHKELIDAKINAYCSIRKQPQKRVQYQVGNGTGALKTYTLPDSGVNQDTLAVYVDGKFISDFGYNTETSEITLTADKDAVVSATYEYGWEMSDWIPMEQGGSQINDSGNYTTEYTYTIPSHDGIFTVTSVKFELARPEGHVDNETIGTGTGRRQMIRLPHIARKETIVCNGKWSYDYDNQRLTIIAPENEPIVISYDWIAESPKVYSIATGWAED